MAQNEKEPFHKVISRELMRVPFGMTARSGDTRAGQADVLLTVLRDSEMPAAAALQLTEDHDELPGTLLAIGQGTLSLYAEEVFEDLRSRSDEPKN
jgi:hypothetical protein